MLFALHKYGRAQHGEEKTCLRTNTIKSYSLASNFVDTKIKKQTTPGRPTVPTLPLAQQTSKCIGATESSALV